MNKRLEDAIMPFGKVAIDFGIGALAGYTCKEYNCIEYTAIPIILDGFSAGVNIGDVAYCAGVALNFTQEIYSAIQRYTG